MAYDHAAFVAGLRELADFYETHPDAPLPQLPSMLTYIADPDQYRAAVRALGGDREKYATKGAAADEETYAGVTRMFGPVAHKVFTLRENVCVRRQVGTETVMEPDPNAMVAVERPVYEYDCTPVLADAEAAAVDQ